MRRARGYSLIEVLVAAVVLLIAIAAAARMAATMLAFEEANARVARALNYQEQACRLYQLGLSTGEVTNVLPAESGVTLTFSPTTPSLVTFNNIGTMEMTHCIMVFSSGTSLTDQTAPAQRTSDILLVRPTIR
jgi:prepilin-type N-terminal cleavage/methylation domain-containing protein